MENNYMNIDSEKMKDILNSLPDIVALFSANRKCTEVFGSQLSEYPEFDMVGRSVADMKHLFVDPNEWENAVNIMNAIDESDDPELHKEIWLFSTQSKGHRYFEVYIKRFNTSKFIIFVRDITEFRELQTLQKFTVQLNKLMVNNKDLIQNITNYKDQKNCVEDKVE